jgi:CRISPR/Cas system-associated exonuclease Cas4 (RecB family)
MLKSRWIPFISFSLLSAFTPAIGQEYWHCDMKRGFQRARKKEPAIAEIVSRDTTTQKIGLLAQRGVFEFHQNPQLLQNTDGIEAVALTLGLEKEDQVVRERVWQILTSYYKQPILQGKKIRQLYRGDEKFADPIEIKEGNFFFKLFAAVDCSFYEPDGTLHILDFKTGQSDFDVRQGYIYLLLAQYLYPKEKVVASFYNLESCKSSETISASSSQLNAIQLNLAKIAKKHDIQMKQYRDRSIKFDDLFPPNPSEARCQHCQFHTVCQFSA